MESRVSYTLVGLFVIVLGAVLVGVIAWLTAATETKQYNYYLVYISESVAGLNINAPVSYKGVQVGQVVSIELDPKNPDLIRLTLKVEESTPIREDTTAKLVSRGITGVVYVELSGSSAQAPPLVARPGEPLPIIRSAPSLVARVEDAFNNLYVRMDGLFSEENLKAIGQILANVRTVTAAVGDNSAEITQTLKNLQKLSDTLAANTASLNKVLAGAGNTFDNSARLTNELRTDLKPLLAQLQTTLASTETMTKAITATSREVGKAADGSRQEIEQLVRKTTPDLNRLLADLRRLTDTMDRFVKTVERDPRMFLFGKPQNAPGPGE